MSIFSKPAVLPEEEFEPQANIPLSMAPERQDLLLVENLTGRKLTRRLTELGLTPGVKLQVVQANGGPLLISVRGSRIAIGRGMAHKLLVSVPGENETAAQNGPQSSNK